MSACPQGGDFTQLALGSVCFYTKTLSKLLRVSIPRDLPEAPNGGKVESDCGFQEEERGKGGHS